MKRRNLCSLLFALAFVPSVFAGDAEIISSLKQVMPKADVRWTPPTVANAKRIKSLFDAK